MRAKSFFFAAIFIAVAAFSLASCAPSLDEPGVPNALVAKPDTLSISSASGTANTTLSFRCGCAFTLDSIIAVSGDIDKIVVTAADQTQGISSHIVDFKAKAGTPSGTYAANYLFKAYGQTEKAFLSAPVYVKLTIP